MTSYIGYEFVFCLYMADKFYGKFTGPIILRMQSVAFFFPKKRLVKEARLDLACMAIMC